MIEAQLNSLSKEARNEIEREIKAEKEDRTGQPKLGGDKEWTPIRKNVNRSGLKIGHKDNKISL